MRVALAHSWRESVREFAFVYSIYIYACAHGRACAHVLCRSMHVNVFVKLWLDLLVLYVELFIYSYSFLLSCNFNIIYKCVCAERCEWVCVRVCTFLAVTELLFGSVLKVGFYIMKWNVIYKCVCVCACMCVRACVCVELLFCLSKSYIELYFTLEHYSYTISVCSAGVSMCVWVLFC